MTTIVTASTKLITKKERATIACDRLFLHDFLVDVARRLPGQIAIETPPASTRSERREISYAELNRKSDKLAGELRDFVKGECVIAICLPRDSEHVYLAQLAVLKAGAAFTCIDPAFPDEQVRYILNDAQPVAILSNDIGLARIRGSRPDLEFYLDMLAWDADDDGMTIPLEPAPWLRPSTLAYLIYTSGTTGRPKGVMIEHRGIVNLVQGDLDTLGVTPRDRVAQNSSNAYDSSVEESWFALASGATLIVMDDETTRLGPDLIAWLRRERITMFCPPPTLLRATGCERPDLELPDLRLLHPGGEALTPDVAERWAKGRCFINDYGPTETTVTALRSRIKPGDPITIGKPVPGLQAWVLDEHLHEVAIGEQGELCITGVGLARGYRNDPEMTERKFPNHPRLGRIYRTGDLVHRDAEGRFHCHGRIDSQVKIRGYRIELEAIETRLAECVGVREAACHVQGEGTQKRIVAFIVTEDAALPPCFDTLKSAVRQHLPEYMVPSQIAMLETLPTTVSGKLNRRALPTLELHVHEKTDLIVAPRNAIEAKLAEAFCTTLQLHEPCSITDDFFHALGGDSLLAAQLISRLRDDRQTATLTVRDLYDARTVAELAKRVPQTEQTTQPKRGTPRPVGRPILATAVQTAWLLSGLFIGAPLVYGIAFHLLPWLAESLGLVPFLLLTPIFYSVGVTGYTILALGLAVAVKKLLIGRYTPTRQPIWGSFFVRNWMVQKTAGLVPWGLLDGTPFHAAALRMLGARIGERVHIHRGVNLLQGGWDLLDLGDDVTLSQDAALLLVDLEDGQIVVGPIAIGNGCTLDVRAGLGNHTRMEADSYLTALSFLPRHHIIPQGERWDGIPANPAGMAPAKPVVSAGDQPMSPLAYSFALALARTVLRLFEAIPAVGLMLAFALIVGLDVESAAEWIFNPALHLSEFLLGLFMILLIVPGTLVFQAIAMRLLGKVKPGVVDRWSLAYLRVWLKTEITSSVNHWLSGSLMWHTWLRAAGMKLGRGSELMTIIDTVPELVTIGPDSFLADGIYLGGPRIHRGTVTLAPVVLGKNTYFGNNALIAGGQTIPDGVLLGVNTIVDDTKVAPGTSWFGHPPFELPKREIIEAERSLTHTPKWLRYANRVFWEQLRFALPLLPLFLVMGWFNLLAVAEENVSTATLIFGIVPLLDLGVIACLCLFGLVLKWALLGCVKPGTHPLWSSWCYRWEFHFMAWDLFSAGPLSILEGTLWLNWFVRGMGARVGRNVALGNGFAHAIDHDMFTFEDGATVTCHFQAHTFEDRVLKIDYVWIRQDATAGNAAVLLYGADIGERAWVLPHSVVMKHERLLPDSSYAGAPTQLIEA